MSILFLSIDLFSTGGIQRQSRHELRALRAAFPDLDVVVCSLTPDKGEGFEEPQPVDLVGGDTPWDKLRFVAGVWTLAQRRGVQLIICDHVHLAPIAYGYHVLRRVPYWVHVHAVEVWERLPHARWLALQNAQRIYSGAEFTRRYLTARYPSLADRLIALGDCVDTTRFHPGAGSSEQLGQLPDGLRLLTVARMVEGYKGHEVVMEAVARLRATGLPITYLIAGDGPDRGRLERVAQDLGLADAVEFLGRVPDAVLPDLYRLADVFVLVSNFSTSGRLAGEGIPLVVLEAQACGKPAVTGRQDGSAESIVDGETGILVDPGDVEGLTVALRRLLTDAPLRSRMGQAAVAHVERTFAPQAFAARFASALREALPALAGQSVAVQSGGEPRGALSNGR